MGLSDEINKLITDPEFSRILRGRLELCREKAGAIEEQLADSQQKAARLEKENRQLRDQIKNRSFPQAFINHKGALFRRNLSGKYEHTAFCRGCREPMVSFQNSFPFRCKTCNIYVNFSAAELDGILKELPK